MKKLLLGTVYGLGLAGIGLAGPALAADLGVPVRVAPVAVMAPAFSWTGFYLGANAGYGGGKFDYPFNAFQRQLQAEAPAIESRLDGRLGLTSSGFILGGQLGYLYQFDNRLVAGVEADFQWSGIEGRLSGTGTLTGTGALPGTFSFDAGSQVRWFGTLRARLGYAFDRTLLYATGGLAYGQVRTHADISVGNAGVPIPGLTGAVATSHTRWGWTVGAGLEYALAQNWSFKTEYLYVDLGTSNVLSSSVDDSANGFTAGANLKVTTRFHTVRAGINYRF